MTGKGRKNTDGFTLIELIVVIAVLTILAGILLASYLGYTKKSKDTADEVTVSQVAKALELQYYAQGLDGSASVRLSPNGLKLTGTGDNFVTQAMQNTFGDTWPGISLRPTDGTPEEIPSKNKDSIPNRIRQTVIDVWNHIPMNDQYKGGGADLLMDTARAMCGLSKNSFSTAWNSRTRWYSGIQVNPDAGLENAAVVADAAAIKARNVYLAEYLLNHKIIDTKGYDALCNRYIGGIMPEDFVGVLSSTEDTGYIKSVLGENAETEAILNAINAYYQADADGVSQANLDAEAYYDIMDKIRQIPAEQIDDTEESWNALVAAVSEESNQEQQPEYGDGSVIITIVGDDQGYHIDIQRG